MKNCSGVDKKAAAHGCYFEVVDNPDSSFITVRIKNDKLMYTSRITKSKTPMPSISIIKDNLLLGFLTKQDKGVRYDDN